MDRFPLDPRPGWRATVEAQGLIWHTAEDAPYWNEAAAYRFAAEEVAEIEAATAELYRLFVQAGDHIVEQGLFDSFDIPPWCQPLIAQAWREEPPALNYGRFDLGYDGRGPPKLFEFNCDTPTSLLEAAVIQWTWKEERYPDHDQFNSLHEKLVAKWRDIAPHLAGRLVHFSHAAATSGEDAVTSAYMMDVARQAGLEVDGVLVGDIGWDGRRFLDLQDREITTLAHLYPWEWLVREPFGRHVSEASTRWIEPIWKMIWSNKAILPILWELSPGHPNLLWASMERPDGDHVAKPILAREGANIRMVRDGRTVAGSEGLYGEGRMVHQQLFELPDFDGACPVIGSWVVDGEPAGMGVREDGPITGDLARFVPHLIG